MSDRKARLLALAKKTLGDAAANIPESALLAFASEVIRQSRDATVAEINTVIDDGRKGRNEPKVAWLKPFFNVGMEIWSLKPYGFIPWPGGRQPVLDDVHVEVWFRGNADYNRHLRKRIGIVGRDINNWQHTGNSNDIVGYRLLEKHEIMTENPNSPI